MDGTQCEMAVDIEAAFVDAGGVFITSNVNAITLMIAISAPNEIIAPQNFISGMEPICEEGEGACYGRGKGFAWRKRGLDLLGKLRARVFKH